MRGIPDRSRLLRVAVARVLALALLLPAVLGALSTPELAREQALYSAIMRSLCAGDPALRRDSAPIPLAGCDMCPTACTVGCAPPVCAGVELGRVPPVMRATFGIALVAGTVGGTSRSDDGLPRGPPSLVM